MRINDNIISFIINESEKIEVLLPETPDLSEGIFRYSMVQAYYIKGKNEQYAMYRNDFITEFIDVLHTACKKLLDDSIPLIASSNQDLGYLWNERLFAASDDDTIRIYNWEYAEYMLWDLSTTSSWLFEKNGNFFFEITPVYEWHFRRPKASEKSNYISYKEFMANCKPHIVTQISKSKILEWSQQTEEILALMNLYDNKYLIRGNRKKTKSSASSSLSTPKDGQKALDISAKAREKGSSSRRIGISDGEIVIFSQIKHRVWHGHIRKWKELDPNMQKVLRELGWTNGKGKCALM